jgi:HAE1 family hydrophobic/amphiphilic exporter-1/multidrug efflux pump
VSYHLKINRNNTELTVKNNWKSSTAEFNNIIIRTEGEKVKKGFSDVGTASIGPENTETKMTNQVLLLWNCDCTAPGANYLDIGRIFIKNSKN